MSDLIKPEDIRPEIFSKEAMSLPDDKLDEVINENVRLHLREDLIVRLGSLDRDRYDDKILAKADKLRTVCANITDEDFLKYLIDEPDGKTIRDYIDQKYMAITGKDEANG